MMSVGPFRSTVSEFFFACFSTIDVLSLTEFGGISPNSLLNSPACGVTTTFLFGSKGNMPLTRALASSDNLTSLSKSGFNNVLRDSISLIANPIPIVAESKP